MRFSELVKLLYIQQFRLCFLVTEKKKKKLLIKVIVKQILFYLLPIFLKTNKNFIAVEL